MQWFQGFENGRTNVHNEEQSGSPSIQIDKIREPIGYCRIIVWLMSFRMLNAPLSTQLSHNSSNNTNCFKVGTENATKAKIVA